jgi:prophage tail gpP-like protein
MLRDAAAAIDQAEASGWSNNIDEDKFYGEGAMQYLIQKEIQTRSGETRRVNITTTSHATRNQAKWMFNENLNWRMDFLGRLVLS